MATALHYCSHCTYVCDCILTIYVQELKSIFCLYMIGTLMHYPKHQALDSRLPGLLLQTAFYQCCEIMRVHFMVLGRVNRTAWDTKLLLTAVWASLVDCIKFISLTEGTALLLSLNGYFNPPSAPHPPPPLTPPPPTRALPIDSIRDITGTEKYYLKNQQHLNTSWN